jgi:hypothetical protein
MLSPPLSVVGHTDRALLSAVVDLNRLIASSPFAFRHPSLPLPPFHARRNHRKAPTNREKMAAVPPRAPSTAFVTLLVVGMLVTGCSNSALPSLSF